MKPAPLTAVTVASPVAALASDGLIGTAISLAVGALCAIIARQAYVQRENKALAKPQRLAETIWITLGAVAMADGIIIQEAITPGVAVFVGLGCGWSTLVLFDIASKLVAAIMPGGGPQPPQQVGLAPRQMPEVDLTRVADLTLPPPSPPLSDLANQADEAVRAARKDGSPDHWDDPSS